jgi:hypothetical protein
MVKPIPCKVFATFPGECPGIDALPMLDPFAAVTRFVSFTLTGSEVTNNGAAAGHCKFPLQIEGPVSRIQFDLRPQSCHWTDRLVSVARSRS